LDITVLHGTARPDEVEFHPGLMRPGIHRLTGKPAAIVRRNGLRRAPQRHQSLHLFDNFFARLRSVGISAKTFPRVLIHHRQDAEPYGRRPSWRAWPSAPASLPLD